MMFFYNYILLILLELSLVSGLIQVSKDYYPVSYRIPIHIYMYVFNHYSGLLLLMLV